LAAYGDASTVPWWAHAFSRTATFPAQALSLESAYYTATIPLLMLIVAAYS
jgi:hypothetical protein